MKNLILAVLLFPLLLAAQATPQCTDYTVSATGRTLVLTNARVDLVSGQFTYYTAGSPTGVSATVEAGNKAVATQTPFTKIAAVTNTTGADMGTAAGAYRYWWINLGTLSGGTKPTVVFTACFSPTAWSRFAWPATGVSGGVLGFTSPTTLASSVLQTANALIVGGGAGATPTPLALGTANYLLGMNADGTANAYRATVASAQGGFGASIAAAGAGLYPKSNGATPAVFAASTLAASGVGACTNQAVTGLNGDAAPTCTTITSAYTSGTFPATAHNLLSATHDATATSAVRGSIIYANSTPAWTALGLQTAGKYPKWDGNDLVASTLAASGVGTPTACTSQFLTGFTLAGDAAPVSTCTSIVAGDLGTTMTPQFARIGLGAAADATDPLNVYNGNALFKYGHIKFTSQVKPGAPTSNAPTDGGACTDGSHVIATTFVTSNGETEYGAVSAAQTCVLGTTKQTIPMSAIPTGITGVTTGRNMCASKAGTVTPLYQVGASPTIADNSTTTYDFVTADASLTVACNAANSTTGGIWVDGTKRSEIDPVTGYIGLPTVVAGYRLGVTGDVYASGGVKAEYAGNGAFYAPYGAGLMTKYNVTANCANTASPAVCGSAAAGAVVIAATATSVVVNTTAVTANSRIMVTRDDSLGTELSVTCNTQSTLVLGAPRVTARTAGTSFTVSVDVGPTTDPLCLSYFVVN